MRSVDVARLDLVHDLLVFLDGDGELVEERFDVEPRVPLGLGLDRIVQRQEAGAAAALHVAAMETVVEPVDPIARGARLPCFREYRRVQIVQFPDQCLAVSQTGCPPRGQALHLGDNVKELPSVVLGERRNVGTALAADPRIRDVAFLHETLKGTSDRGAAQAQSIGDLRLDQARAGGESSENDEFPQVLVSLRSAVDCHRLCGSH